MLKKIINDKFLYLGVSEILYMKIDKGNVDLLYLEKKWVKRHKNTHKRNQSQNIEFIKKLQSKEKKANSAKLRRRGLLMLFIPLFFSIKFYTTYLNSGKFTKKYEKKFVEFIHFTCILIINAEKKF